MFKTLLPHTHTYSLYIEREPGTHRTQDLCSCFFTENYYSDWEKEQVCEYMNIIMTWRSFISRVFIQTDPFLCRGNWWSAFHSLCQLGLLSPLDEGRAGKKENRELEAGGSPSQFRVDLSGFLMNGSVYVCVVRLWREHRQTHLH